MTLSDAILIILVCFSFINVFIIASLITRMNMLEKVNKEMITLVGKTTMANMGIGLPKHMPPNIKPVKSVNPLVG